MERSNNSLFNQLDAHVIGIAVAGAMALVGLALLAVVVLRLVGASFDPAPSLPMPTVPTDRIALRIACPTAQDLVAAAA